MSGLSKDPEKRARQLANLRHAPAPPARNQRGRKHGAFARIRRAEQDAKVAELVAVLADDAPVRGGDGALPRYDQWQVQLLARVLIRLERVETWLDMYGELEERTGNVKPAAELAHKLRKEAADYLDAMGMTPRSRARLGLDLARTADLATAMSEPDPERRKRLMAEAGLDMEDDD